MPVKASCNRSLFAKLPPGCSRAICALAVCLILLQAASTWSQQSRREYIYVDGKLVSVETSSATPLAVNITSPTSNPTYSTNSGSITLSGSLAGHVGATQVTWVNDRGGSGACSGTTAWTCGGITMQIGLNAITVSASDGQSNLGADVLTVDYCGSSLAPTSANAASGGGTGSVSVTCPSGCAWTATSNNAWITVTSGGSGSGNGTVSYSVAANSGSARLGTITIAGRTFTVSQAAFVSCAYSISPTNVMVLYQGGTGSVSVTCPSGCPWTATSNHAWITVTSGGSGSGNGTVGYSVPANNTPQQPRTGTITIAGQTFTILEDCPPPCNWQCINACTGAGYSPEQCVAYCGCN